MNDYKITSSIGDVTVTAIDEKDARRIFRETHSKKDANCAYAITLIRENVPATKAQERAALEKIKAIVATLGPRSYIGTALDGCLMDAEVNIENDFGDSMKARWQDAEKRVAEAVEETAAIREELAAARRAAKDAEDEVDHLRGKVITQADATDITDAIMTIYGRRNEIEARIKGAADLIVEAAENPESEAFQNAVKEHRNAKNELAYCDDLVNRLKALRERWKQ